MRNLLFYNMVCCCVECMRYFSLVLRLAFAHTATIYPQNEEVTTKWYRPLM